VYSTAELDMVKDNKISTLTENWTPIQQ